MAQLVIAVPDAVVPRIREAFGGWVALNPADPANLTWRPATVSELQLAIKLFIKGKVVEHETAQTATLVREEKARENWEVP